MSQCLISFRLSKTRNTNEAFRRAKIPASDLGSKLCQMWFGREWEGKDAAWLASTLPMQAYYMTVRRLIMGAPHGSYVFNLPVRGYEGRQIEMFWSLCRVEYDKSEAAGTYTGTYRDKTRF
ncbi:uncharacterized protein MELLADRAFT_106154 [Melampsora larici-populina 98AG31]|uniref:Uncharacterized protein n=1 Tax=Melampsora larici-populina (strain 98AG31 / pathotype 3-4-7) TaxID=747676 RepID=F4RKK3_MELLP|nr:uncharacterized protein MELLADRAFT_106154 [Melampsora larici-populina 98AG31]EGG07164.1 hypothetical protein MELLADRAFT_106154 [Melampsora larici-populina 98AG31]